MPQGSLSYFRMTLARGTNRIESERLVLRNITEDDLDFFSRVHADPEVARFITYRRPRTPEESLAWIRATLASYEEFALGPLAVLRKSDGALVGRCGLSDLAIETRATVASLPRAYFFRALAPPGAELVFEPELGYTFDRNSWGQGYAAEAARCVFDYARKVLRLPRIISVIDRENSRSLRLAQRFAVRREDSVELMGRPVDRYVWPA
jgi:[ribosomal protein S5]-alanine N-acetyltransferase